jgi:indole-3-glycerol phosphate synthase
MKDTPDILKRIIARKREEVRERKAQLPQAALEDRLATSKPSRGFAARLEERVASGGAAVIAEIKRASPSKGLLRADLEPDQIARDYAVGGATCLSVLTDRDFFRGDDDDLIAARAACNLPVIRKDFVVDPYQVVEARALGADCILLIVACLDDEALRALAALASALGLDVLTEVHDAQELDRALAVPGRLIGINNRDLRTFAVDLRTTLDLVSRIPDDRVVVTESGIHSADDVALMRANGVNAFLVGESLMRAEDPGAQLAMLFADERAATS